MKLTACLIVHNELDRYLHACLDHLQEFCDEIRLWAEYLSDPKAAWLCDDAGRCGGLPSDALFVIAGDHNADPVDGDSTGNPMALLLEHPRILQHVAPESLGAIEASTRIGAANLAHKGLAAQDTGNFGPRVGNLRIDYVLPSTGLNIDASGVFWPRSGEIGADWLDASDHHMVWVDLKR